MTPKVLIVFESMNQYSGGGITLKNLFSSFKKEQLINSCLNTQYVDNDSIIRVESFYQIGDLEKRYRFPMNLFYSNSKSLILNGWSDFSMNDNLCIKKKSNLAKIKRSVKNLLGNDILDYYSYNLNVSGTYLKWIEKHAPDIIYAQVYNSQTIDFVIELKKKTGLPLVLHMMDDWISNYQSNSPISNVVSMKLQELVNMTDLLLTISSSMKIEYSRRYNKDSIVFHNTLLLENWLPFTKKDYRISENVKMLYAGRVGLGTFHSFLSIIKAINTFNLQSDTRIDLYIQTPSIDEELKSEILNYKNVYFNEIVNYDELPEVYSKYDILVLPIDYQSSGATFLKYSMPTKVPEYSITGIPILVYAPLSTVLFEDAKLNEWGYIVENKEGSENDIVFALNKITGDENLRRNLGEKAREYALSNYSSSVVCRNFEQLISSLLKCNN